MPAYLRSFRRVLVVAVLLTTLSTLAGCNALRGWFPSSDHDEVAPQIPTDLAHPAVLIFSKTNGFRHEEAITAGLPFFEAAAKRRGWSLFATENGAVHNPEQLARFDVVVWFQASGDVLNTAQRDALETWIESGGSFFGIHGTGGDREYEWSWQPETLVGAQFIGHPMGPQFQEATVRIEAPEHPALRHLEESWVRTEEWYSFDSSPRVPGTRVLATLDESTYSPRMKLLWMDEDLAMGEDHPIIWTHCIGRGASLYSALGHLAQSYDEPRHQTFLEESIAWLIEERGRDCMPNIAATGVSE
jgi:type 1 glutamine amidotransferase